MPSDARDAKTNATSPRSATNPPVTQLDVEFIGLSPVSVCRIMTLGAA